MASPELLALSENDREALEAWAVEFDQTWQEDALAAWATEKLPEPEGPLHPVVLAELVKVDMERQWQQGNRLTLESYLERFPVLGTVQTVSADLVFAEYDVRQQFGTPVELSEYAGRFPNQINELGELVEKAAAERSVPPLSFEQPPAAERDTSRAGLASETVAPVTPAPKELPETFGRYRVFKKLGQGGMGAVYLVHDTQLDRQVALKVPHFSDQDGSEAVERFLREARAAATIDHPNLCPVYDVGEIDGIHYMTMAYIEGKLLSELIQPGKPTLVRQAVALVRKLALALQEAHDRGIIHRDLKPTNIMMNQRGEPVIMDFGLARRVERDEVPLTQTGAVLGTPAYMSPEQARGRGQEIGPRCDAYSLGVILYELLTGRRPFRGEVIEVLSQILSDEPEPPSTHRPGLDPQLEAICLKAMAKRPENRYETMSDLAAALDEYLRSGKETPVPLPYGAEPAVTAVPPAAPGEETYGLSEALRGLTGLLLDEGPSSSAHDQQAGQSHLPLPLGEGRGEGAETLVAAKSVSRDVPRQRLRLAFLRRVPRWAWIATGTAAVALLLGVILYVSTNYGFVKIQLSDPIAQVDLKLDGTIDITGLDHPLRVRAGQHYILVTGDDFETKSKWFSVKRGKEELVRISFVPIPTRIERGRQEPLPEPPLAVAPFAAVRASKNSEIGPPVSAPDTSAPELLVAPGQSGPVSSVTFSPDGRWLLSASGTVAVLWDATTAKTLRTFRGHEDTVNCAVFSPGGHQVLTGSDDKSAILWDAASGEKLQTLGIDFQWSPIPSVTFSPDGRQILIARNAQMQSGGHIPTLWYDVAHKKAERRLWFGDVHAVAFGPDGRQVLCGCDSRVGVSLWDVATGQLVHEFEGLSYSSSVAFSPTGQQVVGASRSENTVMLWHAPTAKRMGSFEGHTDGVRAVVISSDGRYLLTGSRDSTAILWDVATRTKMQAFQGHTDQVTSVAFSPDGLRVATGSDDKTLRIWDVPTGRELARLISLDAGRNWLVITPQQYCDGSPGGFKHGYWAVGDEVFPLERYAKNFHRPELVSRAVQGLPIEDDPDVSGDSEQTP